METFINYTVLVAGLWLIFQVQVTRSSDFISSIAFKVVPMLIGLACLFSAAKLFGWV